MKKFIVLLLVLIMALAATGCVINPSDPPENPPENPQTEFTGTVAELIENQAHEEKNGYKFCGYFEDQDFTKRVEQTFDTVPQGYYAKYQLDKSALMGHYYTLKHKEVTIDQTIYAEDYIDAIIRYDSITYNDDTVRASMHASDGRYLKLGDGYTQMQLVKGCEDKNRYYDFHDKFPLTLTTYGESGSRQEITVTRNTKWKAYIGEPITTPEGFRYYVVDDSFAVIVGYSNENRVDTLDVPSELGGKPVRVVSVCVKIDDVINVGTINVPSSVENFVWTFEMLQAKCFDKIVFADGVKTIQMTFMRTEKVVLPATVYYIDLAFKDYGFNAPVAHSYLLNQEIMLENNPHYHIKDGFLYTTEGDLVYQYANREILNCQIESGTVRVLRRSVNGIAKNIYVPSSVKYFDMFFNEYSLRYNRLNRANYIDRASMPIFFIESEEVAKSIIKTCIDNSKTFGFAMDGLDDFFLTPLVSYQYNLFSFGAHIDAESIMLNEVARLAEANDMPVDRKDIESALSLIDVGFKIEGNNAYTYIYDAVSGKLKNEWVLCSYLDGTYPIEFISSEPVLADYYEHLK